MPLPAVNLVKVNLIGHLGTQEAFNTGFWLVPTASQTQTTMNSIATGIAALITSTSFVNLRSLLSSGSGYDKVRCYYYPVGAEPATLVSEATISGVVGSGTTYHPLQSSWVVTLKTGIPGQRTRGRMYFPFTAAPLGTDHQFGSSSADTTLTEVQTFFNAVNNLTDVGNVVVVSRMGIGQSNLMKEIAADTRLDEQRRRANKQVATAKVSKTITTG
jgi:hypothetical protein